MSGKLHVAIVQRLDELRGVLLYRCQFGGETQVSGTPQLLIEEVAKRAGLRTWHIEYSLEIDPRCVEEAKRLARKPPPSEIPGSMD
ncbi:MAG TPA: hypothetical protein VM755_15125 [Stellaceae bacterium]|nr:hypothetical protein [Stellaceae bacterium]